MGNGWPLDTGQFHKVETGFDSLVELCARLLESRVVICQFPDPVDPRNSSPQFSNSDYRNFVAGVPSVRDLKKHSQLTNSYFALQVLAIQSGGLVLDTYSKIEDEIERSIQYATAFYALSFDPPRTSQLDEYHDLKIQIGTPGLSAHTSTGYYDQPVFYGQPRIPVRLATIQELKQILESAVSDQDGKLTEKLSGLESRERLSSGDFSYWKDRLHGKKSKSALTVLADEATFLNPPETDVVADPAPDADEQRRILARTAEYLNSVTPRLPDFFATRTTVQYE
jgi:hypothetical protein